MFYFTGSTKQTSAEGFLNEEQDVNSTCLQLFVAVAILAVVKSTQCPVSWGSRVGANRLPFLTELFLGAVYKH